MEVVFWCGDIPVTTMVETAMRFGRDRTSFGNYDLLTRILRRRRVREDELVDLWKVLRDMEASTEELIYWVHHLPHDYYDILHIGELSWLWRVYDSDQLPVWVEEYEIMTMYDYVASHYLLFVHLTRLARATNAIPCREYVRLLSLPTIGARIIVRNRTYVIEESEVPEVAYSGELDNIYRTMDSMIGTISRKIHPTPSIMEHIIYISSHRSVPRNDLLTTLACKLFEYSYRLLYSTELVQKKECIERSASPVLGICNRFVRPGVATFLRRYWDDYSEAVIEKLMDNNDMKSESSGCKCVIM